MPPTTQARRPKSADGHVANTRPGLADGHVVNTRPLRSSPLAGPALNRSLTTPVSTVSINDPTDDPLLRVPTPPICHVLYPKSSQNLDSCDSSLSTPTTSRRRGLGPITAGANRSQSLYIPSTSTTDSGHASPSLMTRASEWEIDPLQSLSISRTPVRPRPSSGIASFRLPIPIVEEEPDCQVEEIDVTDSSSKDTSCNSSTSEFTNSRSSSQPQVNSWYTSNTYDVTPRFSRLGLSSSTVVMPLSPKEHRRVSRRNTSLAKTNITTNSNSNTTSLPMKRFFIPSLSSKTSTITQGPLQQLALPSQMSPKGPPLSRTFSTTSSSETSSITSNSQCETPTPISTSASSPSLTRSRSSEESISTWYESLPPTTPYLEHMPLPAENDGAEYGRDKGAVDGEMRGVGGEFRGHEDSDHSKIHYSNITITIKSASDDHETRPDQTLMTTERPDLHPQPASQQPTTNSPFQTPTFPKDVKRERSSLRKKLVRIKLQPVHDVDDLENVSSSFSSLNIKTMTTIRLTTPRTAEGKVSVGLPEIPVPLVLPATLSVPVVNNSEDTLLSTSSISLPITTTKKKRSTFGSVFRNFIARW